MFITWSGLMKFISILRRQKISFIVTAGLLTPVLLMNGVWIEKKRETPSRSVAESNDPYTFGTGCSTQGEWTQAALQSLNGLYSVIADLKENPKCKGKESTINGIIRDFESAQKELNLSANDENATSIESLPGEISALTQIGSLGGGSENINRLLYRRTIKAAAKGAEEASHLSEAAEFSPDPATAVKALYKRSNRAASYGLEMVSKIFTAIPTLDECIMGQPDIGLSIISAAVKVGGAFGSNGGGAAHSLGNAIASLGSMLRDRNFTRAMRQIDERKFWNSVSCLLETTAKNYCDVENAQEMLKYSKENYTRLMKETRTGLADPQSDNPLEGYYLLSRELPAISNWLMRLKLGTDPRTTADAALQKEAIEKVNEYWKMKKEVAGVMGSRMLDVMALPDLSARQNGMYGLVRELVEQLTKNGNAATFIFQTKREALLPYYLIGLDEIPEVARADVRNTRAISWVDWMEQGGEKGSLNPIFNVPTGIARIVSDRLDSLLRASDTNAAAFFRQRLVQDKLDLINKTLTGNNFTVYESFHHVIRYLDRFERRLLESNSDTNLAMLVSIADTRKRLKLILGSYQRIMALGRDYRDGKIDITPDSADVDRAAKEIIDAVFYNFNVLYQSDVFLTNRLTTYINQDFAILARRGKNLSQHQRDLMFVAQDHLVQKLVSNFGQDQTSALNDMATAQTINDGALKTFEEVFSDTFLLMLEEINEKVHGRSTSPAALQILAAKRLEADRSSSRNTIKHIPLPFFGFDPMFAQFSKWFRMATVGKELKKDSPDLYYRAGNPNRITGGDTANGDYNRYRAIVCAHTLAFEQRDRFYPFCKDAVIESAYSVEGNSLNNLDLRYSDFWPKSDRAIDISAYAKKINRPGNEKLKSKRICAFNNFTIKNWVRVLQDRDQRDDDARTNGEFSFEKEERESREAFEKREAAEKEKIRNENENPKNTDPKNDQSTGSSGGMLDSLKDTLFGPSNAAAVTN